MNHDQLLATLRPFLAEVPTLSLATTDDAGQPHAANLNFVADDSLALYFISNPDSAHARHLAARPRVAAAAYAPFTTPDQIRGVQLHGDCHALPDDRFDVVWATFCAKLPYAAAFEQRARNERFYVLTPTWFRWIDNRVRFGFNAEADRTA